MFTDIASNNPLITHFLNSLDHVCMHPWCSCSDFHSLSNLGLLVTREHISLKRLDILRTVHTQQKFFSYYSATFFLSSFTFINSMSTSLNLLPWLQYLKYHDTPVLYYVYIFYFPGLSVIWYYYVYLFCIFFLFYLYKFAYLTHQ